MKKNSLHYYMRITHRYLGFFLAGIMAVYALSGIILIYRDTDLLKQEKIIEKTLKPNLEISELGETLKIKNFQPEKIDGNIVYFKNGTYNSQTGIANYTSKDLPFVLKKLTDLHKANSKSPLYFLNIFFGISLLFFVVSSFIMFKPKTTTFKQGIYVAIVGIILALVIIYW